MVIGMKPIKKSRHEEVFTYGMSVAPSISSTINPAPASGFVDDRFLAEHTPYGRSWWQHLRARGEGPATYRISGRRLVYRWHEVLAWLESQAVRIGGAR